MASSPTIRPSLVFVLLLASTPVFAQGRQSLPIAYVSVQRILNEAEGTKEAAKELEALRQKRAEELNAKKRALDETKLQLVNAGGMFSGSKRQQLSDLAKKQESELQQATQQAQTELQDRQKKVQQQLGGEISKIIAVLAQERGVQYVLNQDIAVLHGPPSANWTNEVLQRLNAVTASQKGAADGGSAQRPAENKTAPKAP
jgi:outer membrane protein